MPKQEIFHLHPLGWENDPEEERIKFSTLDYLPACVFNNYVLFFKLDDADKSSMVALLKEGLERTLSQARHLCGTIEKDETAGGHSFVKHKDSTVQFHVQWLDSPQDLDNGQCYPAFDDLESRNFSSTVLGDLELWSVPPMTHGLKPEAHIDNSPVVSAFKANFIRGGLVFNMHVHHCSNDIMGWASFTHQLADNCRAIHNKIPFPGWDPACLDRSRLSRKEVPEEAKIDSVASGLPHPDLMPVEPLLFHLPKSKAVQLKALATPGDDSSSWISTFDAFSAFIWRTLLRLRAPVFKTDPSDSLVWMGPVDMRRRLQDPPCPPRTQGNLFFIVQSEATAKFVAESPLSEVAAFIRRLTDSATPEELDRRLDMVAAIRDKTSLLLRTDVMSPLTLLVTDWRAANIGAADFGLATPAAFRHVSDKVTRCVVQVYPPRTVAPGSDEGCEFAIVYERSLARWLIEDPEWSQYFEYRGLV